MGSWRSLPLLAALLLFLASAPPASADSLDADVLLQFKATISDATGTLKTWDAAGPAPCQNNLTHWAGVLCGYGGDVSGLRLEDMTLSGSLSHLPLLGRPPALRTLSFMRNSFDGPMPAVSKLQSLRAVYLSWNKFSGEIPGGAFEGMSWLKKLYLADNGFSGPIPKSLADLPKLLELRLDNNRFSGSIPNIQSRSAKLVNLSNNYLEGPIPAASEAWTPLCLQVKEEKIVTSSDPLRFLVCAVAIDSVSGRTPPPALSRRSRDLLSPLWNRCSGVPPADAAARRRYQPSQPLSTNNNNDNNRNNKAKLDQCSEEMLEHRSARCHGTGKAAAAPPSTKGHEHTAPKLIFVRQEGPAEVVSGGSGDRQLRVLVRASLTGGPSVVAKRYRDMNRVGKEDFEEHMRRLGRLSHPNLLPLLAYYYRKDEKLLVADYVPKTSLAMVLHESFEE